jgi:hypothetical protein
MDQELTRRIREAGFMVAHDPVARDRVRQSASPSQHFIHTPWKVR